MSLTSNPFHILGAKMTDDRRQIVALAKEKAFGGDEEAVREAQGILLTPRKRLAAEIAWLPGVEPDQIGELLRLGSITPTSHSSSALFGRASVAVPGLARANLLAHMLLVDAIARQPIASEEWARRIALLAGAHHAVRADEVTALVNEGRLAASVPTASKQDVIEELEDRANSFRVTIEHCLNDLPLPVMVKAMTSTVNIATRNGGRHAPALIDSLIDSYYIRRMSGMMDEREKGIAALVSRVRNDVSSAKFNHVHAMVAEIERSLRAWDALAQPIQLSLASRGMSHSPSKQIMRDTRNLAQVIRLKAEVFLPGELINGQVVINGHGIALLKVARRLTKTMRQVFAEMEPITDLLDKDVATLDDLPKAMTVETADTPLVRFSRVIVRFMTKDRELVWLLLWLSVCSVGGVVVVGSAVGGLVLGFCTGWFVVGILFWVIQFLSFIIRRIRALFK